MSINRNKGPLKPRVVDDASIEILIPEIKKQSDPQLALYVYNREAQKSSLTARFFVSRLRPGSPPSRFFYAPRAHARPPILHCVDIPRVALHLFFLTLAPIGTRLLVHSADALYAVYLHTAAGVMAIFFFFHRQFHCGDSFFSCLL